MQIIANTPNANMARPISFMLCCIAFNAVPVDLFCRVDPTGHI